MKLEWLGWSIAAICICTAIVLCKKMDIELQVEVEKTKRIEMTMEKCKG